MAAVVRKSPEGALDRYLRESEGPLSSLLFVLPLAAAYELANRGYFGASMEGGPGEQLVAFSLLRQSFNAMSATGAMLPALTLTACLLGWQVGQRRAWSVRPHYLAVMLLEAAALALPAVALALLLTRWMPWSASTLDISETRLATLAIGAAVYEELLFRLISFVLIHALMVDLIGLNRRAGTVATLIFTSLLFAAYHYLGRETFDVPSFVFRTGAGLFLGAIFLLRGFGITVGCHAIYDLLWVLAVRQHLAM